MQPAAAPNLVESKVFNSFAWIAHYFLLPSLDASSHVRRYFKRNQFRAEPARAHCAVCYPGNHP